MLCKPTGLRFRRGGRFAVVLLAVALSGCIASTRNPERLIPVPVEMEALALDQSTMIAAYNDAVRSGASNARTIRNEIITRRMYAIDVQYTQYENALTREGQEIGFGALTAATGLSTAATLVAVNTTKTILSAAATGVLATKGHYESQVLINQAIRTIQKQMRSSRNTIAATVSAKMAQNVADYPLWAALSDVEDYYNAGTLTTGVIDVSTTVGAQETFTKEKKEEVNAVRLSARSSVLAGVNEPIPLRRQIPERRSEGQIGEREARLSKRIIKQMQSVFCVAQSGVFSADLRQRVIRHLAKNGRTSSAVPDRLTEIDVADMQDDADNGVKDCNSAGGPLPL